jgi:hypothetical protein
MGSSVSGMESKCEERQAQCRVVNGIGIPRQRCGFLNLFTPWIQRSCTLGQCVVYVKFKNDQTERVVWNYHAIVHERLWTNPNVIIGTRSSTAYDYKPATGYKLRQCLTSTDGQPLCPENHPLVKDSFRGFHWVCDSCVLNYRPMFNYYRCTICHCVLFCQDCVDYEINKFNRALTATAEPLLLNNLSHINPLAHIIIHYLLST